MAEAYEGFEDFLEHLYASIGYVDYDFCPASDYKNTHRSDLHKKDYDWFLNQVAIKKSKPNSILACFRNKFDELRNLETKNKLDCHVGFELCLISKLRHLIVHNSGAVKNKEKVIERIFKDCGINDRDKPVLSLKANKFFSKLKSSEETHVFLLGHTDPTYGLFSTFNLSDLLSLMMSYAQILAELSLKHLYNNNLLKPREKQE